MTSFFEIKGVFLRFSRKRQDESAPNFFQGLKQNTCLLQSALLFEPALKSNAPGL